MKTLITGASGWLGLTLATHLLQTGHVTAKDLILVGSSDRLVEIEGATFKLHALSDFAQRPSEVEVAYHFAAITKDRLPILGVEKFQQLSRQIFDHVNQILRKVQPRAVIVASSGAAALAASEKTSEDSDPYGFAKWYEEKTLACELDAATALHIYRIWSMTGTLINKHNSYAVTDFIQQAIRGDSITVSSRRPTWRRYASAEQLVQLMAVDSERRHSFALDVGGEIVEMRDLASRVAAIVKPNCSILHDVDNFALDDKYFATSYEYEKRLAHVGMEPMSLDDQIKVVAATITSKFKPLNW